MKNLAKVLAVVFLNLLTVPLTEAAGPSPLEAYLKAYNDMAKLSAVKVNSLMAESKARDSYISTMANAQAKLISAKAALITAVANANATNASWYANELSYSNIYQKFVKPFEYPLLLVYYFV